LKHHSYCDKTKLITYCKKHYNYKLLQQFYGDGYKLLCSVVLVELLLKMYYITSWYSWFD